MNALGASHRILLGFGACAAVFACGRLEIGAYASKASRLPDSAGGSESGLVDHFVPGVGGTGGSLGSGGSPMLDAARDVSGNTDAADSSPPIVEKPDYLKLWEPHHGNATPRVTALSDGSVRPILVGYDNGDVFMSFFVENPTTWLKVDEITLPVYPKEDYSLPQLFVSSLFVDPQNTQASFASFAQSPGGHKIWRTGNGAEWWVEMTRSTVSDVFTVTQNPAASSFMYAASSNYVFTSRDWGENWSVSYQPSDDPLLPPQGTTVSTAVRIDGLERVWIGGATGELYATPDLSAGTAWASVRAPDMPARVVSRITPNRANSRTIYVTFAGPIREGLWRTDDGGTTWTSETSGLPAGDSENDSVYGASVHPLFDNIVYLGTSRGAYWSDDGGNTWHP